jgi:hypothetical protein
MKFVKFAAIAAFTAAAFSLSACCSSSKPAPASMGYSK